MMEATSFGLALIVFSSSGTTQNISVGKRAAEDSMALLSFVAMGNIGAADIECKGALFAGGDINAIVAGEIVPVFERIARFDNRSGEPDDGALMAMLKSIVQQSNNGVMVIKAVYDQKKDEAIAEYGRDKACSVLSAMFQAVIQQRRLSLRNIYNSLR